MGDSANGLYADYASIFMIISALAGLALFIYWAVKNRFGKGTLDKAGFRANFMPYYLPFAVIFGWLGLTLAASNLAENLTAQMPDWQQKFAVFSFFVVIEIVVIVFILVSAKKHFQAGLRGFGLSAKGYLAILPLLRRCLLRSGRWFWRRFFWL